MIEKSQQELSVRRQCVLLKVNKSSLYYQKKAVAGDAVVAGEIDEIWHEMPFYGYRRITKELQRRDHPINHKKVMRIMREMQIRAIYPRPRYRAKQGQTKYPYLLKDLQVVRPNQIWSTDITYIKMPRGFCYLVGVIDVYSRRILAWRLSTSLETEPCLQMLAEALERHGAPEIINTDQGVQFTGDEWIRLVENSGAKVNMDGIGRWADNIFIERFWRSLNHEHVLLHAYSSVCEARDSIGYYINLYNTKRLHQALNYRTPAEVYNLQKIHLQSAAGNSIFA